MPRRWIVFILATSLFFLSQFYRTSSAVIASELIRDLSLDTEGLGLMSASFFYAFAITQIPIILLIDKVGPRRLMTCLTLLGIVGAVIFSLADSLSLGLFGRILLGVGMACNLMGTFKLLTEWFEPLIFATLTGLVVATGTFGNIMATTPLVMLVEQIGWRHSFQLIAAINLVLVLMLYIVVRDRPSDATRNASSMESTISFKQAFLNLALLLKERDYWIISMTSFVRYGTFAALQALWAGPFLREVMGYSAVKAGNLLLLMTTGMIIGSPFWGAVSDRIFRTRKWIIVFCLLIDGGVALVLMSIPPDADLIVIAALFFAFGFFSAAGMLVYPHIKDLMPQEMAGAAMTGVNFFNMLGPAVFLHGMGVMMQALYPGASRGPAAFDASFLVCTLSLLIAGGLYSIVKEKKEF
ncbi:MAG: MFS transporter [Desulfobacterales bacterium]|jgi:sugar phosphate permease|nr:MFS transporter [Desulfobacterales bacterium]